MVGAAASAEETGAFFEDALVMLEKSPFLRLMTPWGDWSVVKMQSRNESNDGPIMWIRPGEQLIPTDALRKSSPEKKK